MKQRALFIASLCGAAAGLVAAAYFGFERKPQPPAFAPVSSPYDKAIYANGIVESDQAGGSNITLYPEASGPVARVAVGEGDAVKAGDPLLAIDASLPRANRAVAAAASATARDQYEKRRASYALDPRSISLDALDAARNADRQATAALQAADVALQKYSLHAPVDGVVLAVNTTIGSYVSPQGAYDAYSQGYQPVIVMSAPQQTFAVRCYVDEILVSRLPPAAHMRAQMSIRGTDVRIPLEFVRVQPYVSPKLQLSNQRQEKVDLRVLPVIFRLHTAGNPPVYPGQLVDVFIGQQ